MVCIHLFSSHLLIAYSLPGTVFEAGAPQTLPSRWLHSNGRRQKLSANNTNDYVMCQMVINTLKAIKQSKGGERELWVRDTTLHRVVRAVHTDGGRLKVLSEWLCQRLLKEWGVGFLSHFTQIYS